MENNKYFVLGDIFQNMGAVIVAYSGGVDSALLLKIAYDCLGAEATAITAVSASIPRSELEEACSIASQIGARHILIESHELVDARYLENSPNRCYFCKSDVYGILVNYAREHGIRHVVDGANADDVGDYRPGRKAASEYGLRSPLQEVGLTKAEIRILAKNLGLANWNKPSAACLSSRIPYGTPIRIPILQQVEQAELLLREMGFSQVRVRHHDRIARIEVEEQDFPAMLEKRTKIIKGLKGLGYVYITLDLLGFRSGSMNMEIGKYGREQNLQDTH